MSKQAYLPCFKCGKTLDNVFEDSDNQPYGGTCFTTEGHYGSTFWDSFDGESIVINICDSCLTEHQQRIGQQKTWMPIMCEGMLVGRYMVDRPLVAFTGNPDGEKLNVEIEELGNTESGSRIQWAWDIQEIKQALMQEIYGEAVK